MRKEARKHERYSNALFLDVIARDGRSYLFDPCSSIYVLGAMTFPAIIYSADKIAAGVAGTVVALIMAYRRRSLLTVALAACAAAFLVLLIV